MVTTLAKKTKAIKLKIETCLSSSGVCGYELRNAHYYLGQKLGQFIVENKKLSNKRIGVLIMMRAGLPFGFGVADALEMDNDVSILFSTSTNNDFSTFDLIVIADAVVNTGKTILEISNYLNIKTLIAANVISDKYLDNLTNLDIYAVRISQHSFKGDKTKTISNGKGPDTGERLFSNTFLK